MLSEKDFLIVPDEYGWKLINNHKLKILREKYNSCDPAVYKGIWKQCHTHLLSKNMAYVMRDNLIKSRIPKTRNKRILMSHIRIAEDEIYISKIKKLIYTRNNKGKQEYLNERRESSNYRLSKQNRIRRKK
ncbi:MAG: hypothetical protein K0Q47_18 [Sedimentibacter sp.]|jgi:hypothetical protein|nr:hypothetical protein [Sedimentibacter sp.]